jgi:prolyl oligopeptidase
MQGFDRRSVVSGLVALGALPALPSMAQGAAGPPVARTVDAVDRRFGMVVPDPYRWMENPQDPEWEPFMRGQAAHARAVLDAIPGRARMAEQISALTGDLPVAISVQRAGPRTFLEFRPAGSNLAKLYVIDRPGGERRLLIDPETRKDASGAHLSLDWWRASPDGAVVAYGMSAAGSEESVARFLRVADGTHFPEEIDRARFGTPAWLPDGSGFFFLRGREGAVRGAPDYLLNAVAWFHRLGTDPRQDVRIVSGGDVVDGYTLQPNDFPFLITAPGSDMALMVAYGGVRNINPLFTASLADLVAGEPRWRTVARMEDEVSNFAMRGREAWVVSERNAPLGRILALDLANPDMARAHEVVPEARTPIDTRGGGIVAARDGLYFVRQAGGPMTLHRLGPDGRVTDIAMPFDAGIYDLFASPDADGVDVRMAGWTRPSGIWRFDPAVGKLADTGLSPLPAFDVSAYESFQIMATAKDGTRVPVSVITRKGLKRDGQAPCLAQCYSAYQVSSSPFFSPRFLPFLDAGGVLAEVHARGGGEFGRPWHEAGQKATKPNTWNDFIAGAEALIAERITSTRHLTIMGTSAGGIAVGRAMTTRPDLFAGAVVNVGVTNNARSGVEQNAAPNFPEFGDPSVEAEYKALVAMDTVHHVRDGERYPAVLVIHGMTDPRVAPWHSAKLAARLQKASASGRPVLLRVTFDAGHGLGSTRAQADAQWADILAFTLWRAGAAGGVPA